LPAYGASQLHNNQLGTSPFVRRETGSATNFLSLLPELAIEFVAYGFCNEVAFSSRARLQLTAEGASWKEGAITP
jgi:hypothetical protein